MTTTAPAATVSMAAAPPSGSFVTDQKTGEFRASKFVGLDIYGSENQKIGDINEILIDGGGSAKAIIIGVGGFLGIGQKNVAVPFSSVEWRNEKTTSDRPATTSAMTTPMTSPATTSSPSAMTGATSTGAAPASPMATSTPATPARSPAETAAFNGYPDHGMIKMTKADLENAPAFKYYSETTSSAGAATTPTPPPVRQ